MKEKWKLSFVKVQQKPFFENVISEADYLWVMRYGDGLEIISPKDIRKEFAEELKKFRISIRMNKLRITNAI